MAATPRAKLCMACRTSKLKQAGKAGGKAGGNKGSAEDKARAGKAGGKYSEKEPSILRPRRLFNSFGMLFDDSSPGVKRPLSEGQHRLEGFQGRSGRE